MGSANKSASRERLAFFGFTPNFMLFLVKIELSDINSSEGFKNI